MTNKTLKERLLEHFSLTEEEYLAFQTEADPFNPIDISHNPLTISFIKELEKIRDDGQKVLIYGDYDVDGITSTSILTLALREYGISCEAYLPSRYLDGYGLTVNNVEKIAKKGFGAILTCDNGISAFEAIDKANELGLKVLVLDHHEMGERLPNALAILHFALMKEFDVAISAGELSYYFSLALLKRNDPYLLTLGAISCLSDLMPLRKSNHALVKRMLKIINEEKFRNLFLLTSSPSISGETLQMEIIPKLNAVGRMEKGTSINRLLPFFLDINGEKNESIAAWLNEVNENRKGLTREVSENLSITPTHSICIKCDVLEGLNGLLANRLMQNYGLPTVIFAKKEGKEGVLVGSIRSQEGFDVLECLKSMHDIEFLTFGGHSFAGGVSIREEQFDSFAKQFDIFAELHPFVKKEEGIELDLSECNRASYDLIETFAPFGHDYEKPKFLLRIPRSKLRFTKGGKYLLVFLNEETKLFSFSVSEWSEMPSDIVTLTVTFTLENYRGKESVTLFARQA